MTEPCHECHRALVLLEGYHLTEDVWVQHVTCGRGCFYMVFHWDHVHLKLYMIPYDKWSVEDKMIMVKWLNKQDEKDGEVRSRINA